jgi:hypothetical protein
MSSCSKIGSPTIEYIDENNNKQIITVYQSNNEEYVKNVIKILNSIKTKENYSYTSNCNISMSFKAKYNNTNVVCSYNMTNIMVYNHLEDINYYSIINTQNIYLEDSGENVKSYELNYEEYQYPNSISYVTNNDIKYKETTNINNIENNFLYKLNFNDIFNNISDETFNEYKIIIADSNKEEIKFYLTSKEKESDIIPMTICISPSTGLMTSIYLNPLDIIVDEIINTFSDETFTLENAVVSSSNVSIQFSYNDIINIVLSESEKLEYK